VIAAREGPQSRVLIRSTKPLGRATASYGDSRGLFCKPEVTGSIPVRSTRRKPRKRGAFVVPRGWRPSRRDAYATPKPLRSDCFSKCVRRGLQTITDVG
jgi:hypothetical protein